MKELLQLVGMWSMDREFQGRLRETTGFKVYFDTVQI